MPNDINSISPSIRDFLLNKNLILADSIANNGLNGVAIGLGQNSSLETLPVAVQASKDIEVSSIDYRINQINKNSYSSTDDYILTDITTQPNSNTLPLGTPSVEYGSYIGSNTENSTFNNSSNNTRQAQVSKNRYVSQEQMVSATVINNSFAYKQVDGGYLDENNNLNLGGPSTQPYDVLGSILTQDGFGLDSNGLTSQFDIRSSLAGRVLGATGAINDTPLGIIAGQQMLLALGQRAAFNVQKEISGKVNLQPFSLLRGADFINPDWTITVKGTLGGKIFDSALNLAGFEVPKSIIDNGASIFQDDDGYYKDSTELGSIINNTHRINSGSISRNNALIINTGKGQLIRLFDLLNRNIYKPNYETSGNSKLGIEEPNTYPNTASDLIDFTDPISIFDGTDGMYWDNDVSNPTSDDKSLIAKTKRLFNDNKDLYEALFNKQGTIGPGNNRLNVTSGGRLSKGSGVLSEEYINNNSSDNVFCRTWTSTDRYDNVGSLQKNSGLYGFNDKIREGITDSVLGSNGFVKITPYNYTSENVKRDEVQKYMFSIENLAWNDRIFNLPANEVGNGDLITGTKGRIMWFPPYGIKFTDTTAVNWDTTNFIGRGEPIYTYNNTERSGTLEFQIIIDYPDYMNNTDLKTDPRADNILSSIAAGCTKYNTYFSPNEVDSIKNEINSGVVIKQVHDIGQSKPKDFNIYFPNDSYEILEGYEVGLTSSIVLTPPWDNNSDFGLNSEWYWPPFIENLKTQLNGESNAYEIEITGYASKDGNELLNNTLASNRALAVEDWVLTNLSDGTEDFKSRIKKVVGLGEIGPDEGAIDSEGKKRARIVQIKFIYKPELNKQLTDFSEAKTEPTKETKEFVTNIKKRFHREDTYFKELMNSDVESDKIIYKNIREKIGFFQPAFHSITPEGFNSRLTFLQQCTRQGPTDTNKGVKNLAFGMPPVCILRIGDFYHTKIVINSLGITYEPLLWDLNPEGVGVQPRIANVNIAFKFIGGSSLNGPINRLQNAVSFNYFANTGVYDPRADRIAKIKTDKKGVTDYEIIDGVTNMLENSISENIIKTPPIVIDQKIANDVELSKIEGPKIIDDKTELSFLRIWGNDRYTEGDDYIDTYFRYYHNRDSTYTLEKLYTGKVYLKSTKDQTLNVYLGLLTIEQDSPSQLIVKNEGGVDSEVIYNTGDAWTQFSFSLNNLSDTVQSKLLGITNNGGGYLQLIWPTGSKSNINLT